MKISALGLEFAPQIVAIGARDLHIDKIADLVTLRSLARRCNIDDTVDFRRVGVGTRDTAAGA